MPGPKCHLCARSVPGEAPRLARGPDDPIFAAGEALIEATVAALATFFSDFAQTQLRAGAP